MALSDGKLAKIRQRVRLHVNWFIAAILGEDVLTAEERKELENFKKLPKQNLSFVEKSFILGRLKAILKKGEWKDLNWEDLLAKTSKPGLSSLEKFALRQAKLRAAQHVKNLADDISKGVFADLAAQGAKVVTEASIKQIISDEVQLGIVEKKHYKEVASKLAERTKTKYGRDWEMISRTELHTVKMLGLSQAIINKVDVYKNSNGIDSLVSIVPKPGTCPDCADHYLENDGNPKVFVLRDLLNAGSNGDPGVVHTKTKGIHTHWKTTLPALHPRCRCQLVYIPPGYGWVSGKLVIVDRSKLSKALSKAIGDSKLSATSKPPGPASAQPKTPNPPSIPGVKSPAQQTPSGGGSMASKGPQMDPCPFGGGDDCKKHGGSGAKTHESGGAVMRAHAKALASGAKPSDPEAANKLRQQEVQEAVAYGKANHPHAVKLAHIKDGKISQIAKLDDTEKGFSESYRVVIEGNGRAIIKPTYKEAVVNEHGGFACGDGTVPTGTSHKREEAAYNLHMALGLSDHVPPTATRNFEGRDSSSQSWEEGYSPMAVTLQNRTLPAAEQSAGRKGAGNRTKELLELAPPDKREALRNKMDELIVMQLTMNSNDAHNNNIIVKEDYSDIKMIDNSASFGLGMYGCTSGMLRDMHNAGMKVKMPEHMRDKFKKTTYGDLKRSCGNLEPLATAQTFIRMRYLDHLQETDGHIDYNKFRPEAISPEDGAGGPRPGFWGADKLESIHEYIKASKEGKLASQQFHSFMTDYVKQVQSDPNHPDHHSVASILYEVGEDQLFMDSSDFVNQFVRSKRTPKPSSSSDQPKPAESNSPKKDVPRSYSSMPAKPAAIQAAKEKAAAEKAPQESNKKSSEEPVKESGSKSGSKFGSKSGNEPDNDSQEDEKVSSTPKTGAAIPSALKKEREEKANKPSGTGAAIPSALRKQRQKAEKSLPLLYIDLRKNFP